MAKTASHFVDSDITGTSGLDSWVSGNYSYPVADPAKRQIYTPQDLQDMQKNLVGDYELMNDIDMSGFDWTPVGRNLTAFTGSIDGHYFTISNLTITDETNESGLFGKSTAGAQVDNIRLTNVSISSTGNLSTVGLLIGDATDIVVNNCHTQGTVTVAGTTSSNIGGIVGTGPATLTRCSANIVVTSSGSSGLAQVGGIAGTCSGTYTDCYSVGSVTLSTGAPVFGLSRIGGFGGKGSEIAVIENCYSAMTISGTERQGVGGFIGGQLIATTGTWDDCFWDVTILSGKSDIGDYNADQNPPDTPGDIAGITASTTSAMYQEATYTNWDFDTVWEISEGSGYPTHQWVDTNPHEVLTGYQRRTTAMPTDRAHLNGESVQILQDGLQIANQTITGGALPTPLTGAVNHVGLGYTMKINPMKIDGEISVKKIGQIVPEFYETLGGNYGDAEDNLYSMNTPNSPLDPANDLYSGYVELQMDSGYGRSGDIWITQDAPLPMTLLGIGIRMSKEDI